MIAGQNPPFCRFSLADLFGRCARNSLDWCPVRILPFFYFESVTLLTGELGNQLIETLSKSCSFRFQHCVRYFAHWVWNFLKDTRSEFCLLRRFRLWLKIFDQSAWNSFDWYPVRGLFSIYTLCEIFSGVGLGFVW